MGKLQLRGLGKVPLAMEVRSHKAQAPSLKA